MKQPSKARRLTLYALSLTVAGLLPGACASEETSLPPNENAGTGAGARAGTSSSGGNAGKSATGGSGGGSAGTSIAKGGSTPSEGGEPGSAGTATAGTAPVSDRCQTTSDCNQVPDSCFVCETVGTAKDCVDHGPPVCDNGKLDPCEMCEVNEVKVCTELGEPGEFSGGNAKCNATCNGWDTSTCSVCGNLQLEAGEECDGAAAPDNGAGGAGAGGAGTGGAGMGADAGAGPSADAGAGPSAGGVGAGGADSDAHTCKDEGIAQNPNRVTPCTDTCQFDTTVCSGCSKGVASCLDGDNCTASACNGAECKLGTTCNINCGGGGKSCEDVHCNHDATCDFACNSSGDCRGVVCDSGSSCELDCSGGGSSCDGTICKASATCDFDCHNSGSCQNVKCQPGADCDFDCSGGGSVCSGEVTCSAGRSCDFECGVAGNCADLEVTCEAGSTCTFNCSSGGSKCPKATCRAGADCAFDCSSNGDCNSPSCASGACTGN